MAFAAKPLGLASGNEKLVVSDNAVFVLNRVEGSHGTPGAGWGTELWRSTNLRDWQRMILPSALASARTQMTVADGTGLVSRRDASGVVVDQRC